MLLAKKISAKQLAQRKRGGAKATKQASEVVVRRFDELLEKLDAFEKLNDKRAEAQLKLIETMQQLLTTGRETEVDLSPMQDVLERIEAMSAAKEPVGYEFTFKHRRDGRYKSMTATPKVTKH